MGRAAHWLTRPGPPPDAATRAAFDALLADAVAAGPDRPIDYRLAAPRWQFLCHVAEREAPYPEAGRRAETAQAAALEPVAPLAKLTVERADFPLPIRGHDHPTLVTRIEADPDGFPWLADDEL